MARRIPAAGIAAAMLTAVACERSGSVGRDPGGASPSRALGEDGALVVDAPGTMLNGWTALTADAPAGTTTLVIASAGQLDLPAPMGPIGPGDLVLVIQMQGAVIDSSDSPAFGAVTDLAGAGRYELALVGAVTGTSIDLSLACGGLESAYSVAGRTQVVRVPQLASLDVTPAGSVVALPWNGERGGIVAVHVTGAATIDGVIDVSGAGFRGGIVDFLSGASGSDNTTWRSPTPEDGGEKGEGIAGFGADYDARGGRYGRAAPANAGGGGTAHNAGGGGGANASNGDPWTGQGVMDPATTGAAAWTLDPGYIANGNAFTRSSGGGRGGYTFSANDQDALTLGPGNASWGGNSRRERGGLGGRPLDAPVNERLFLGGGGGAGDGNNGEAGSGGRGGGIVLLSAMSVSGSGAIRADGASGGNTIPSHSDGAGGGGGGGTIAVETTLLVNVTVSANGGNGGDQLVNTNEAEGPGGGGGGGRIAVSIGLPPRTALGGANGITTSNSHNEFPANGATRGAEGVEADELALGEIRGCRPGDVSVTKTDFRDTVRRGARTEYEIVISLDSDVAGASGIRVEDPLPEGARSASWTCEATPGSACAEESGTGAIDTTVDLAAGGSATFHVDVRLSANAGDTLENTVTVTGPPGFADADPSNDTATDVNEVIEAFGVAGSGCECRVGGGGAAAPWTAAALGALALALTIRRRRIRA